MSRCIRKQHKIRNMIICFITINMVNYLLWFKVSSQMLFHYQSLFKNSFIAIGKRMIRQINPEITIGSFNSTTFPMMISRTNHMFASFHFWGSFIFANFHRWCSFKNTCFAFTSLTNPLFMYRGKFFAFFADVITSMRAIFTPPLFNIRWFKFFNKQLFANWTYFFNNHFNPLKLMLLFNKIISNIVIMSRRKYAYLW